MRREANQDNNNPRMRLPILAMTMILDTSLTGEVTDVKGAAET